MSRKIAMVFNQTNMKSNNQDEQDFEYWINKTPQERLAGVTFLIRQNLEPTQRMNKAVFNRKPMKK